MNFLAGYRTYIIVALFLVCVISERFLNLDIPGFAVGDNWLEMAMAMLGIGTLRASIAAK